jgi:hypothetical protein
LPIAASQPLYLTYIDVFGNEMCQVQASFIPDAGKSYVLLVGDTPPKAGMDFWDRLLKGPEFGAKCFVAAATSESDGHIERVPLHRWRYYKLLNPPA